MVFLDTLRGKPMKIVLATYGTRGDVQPMLALSLTLKLAGHDVLLVGPPEKAAWAAELGCPYHPLGGNITAVLDTLKDGYSFRSAAHLYRKRVTNPPIQQ
jgi:UDP:flavonoid glycosyltransferase YjiC (YdhE family)